MNGICNPVCDNWSSWSSCVVQLSHLSLCDCHVMPLLTWLGMIPWYVVPIRICCWLVHQWCVKMCGRISAHVWCLVRDWWTRLSACCRDVSWYCAILARKLHQVNEAWTVFWNAQNVLSWMYDVLMCCHWWSLMSRTWCTNATVVGIEYHWRSQGQECVCIAYCGSAIRSYCQNTSRLSFLLSAQMQSYHRIHPFSECSNRGSKRICGNGKQSLPLSWMLACRRQLQPECRQLFTPDKIGGFEKAALLGTKSQEDCLQEGGYNCLYKQ